MAARYAFSRSRESRMVLDLFSFFRRRCRKERWGRSIFVRLYVVVMAPGLLLTLPPKIRCFHPLCYGTHLPETVYNGSLHLTSPLCPNTGNTGFMFAVGPSAARHVLSSLWHSVFHCLYIGS
jgi:hypothetical protein